MKKILLTNEQFIQRSKEVHGDKYNYILFDYKGSKIKGKIICKKHGEFWQKPNDHLTGCGCPNCKKDKLKYTLKEFVKKCKQVHCNKYDYSLVNYINYLTKIKIVCPIHGIFEQIPRDHLQGCGCQICNESKGELQIRKILIIDNKIKFKEQKTFNECKGVKRLLPFDFYLPDYNTCIEYDGEQHFEPIDFSGKGIREKDIKAFNNLKINDNIKTNYCLQNNINLFRIKYDENIKDKMFIIKEIICQ